MTNAPSLRSFNDVSRLPCTGIAAGIDPDDRCSRPERVGARKRKRPGPISVRLNAEELAQLKSAAGSQSLNGCIRERLFAGDEIGKRRTRRREKKAPSIDHVLLGQLLSALGRSGLAPSLSRLSCTVCDGPFEVSVATERAIRHACADIAGMRAALMQALDLRKT